MKCYVGNILPTNKKFSVSRNNNDTGRKIKKNIYKVNMKEKKLTLKYMWYIKIEKYLYMKKVNTNNTLYIDEVRC